MHAPNKKLHRYDEAMIGISSIINNIVLFCQDCVNLKEKVVILDRIFKAQSQVDFISEVKTEIGTIKAEVQNSNLAMKAQQRELNEVINAQTAPPPEQKSVPRPVQNKTNKRDQLTVLDYMVSQS